MDGTEYITLKEAGEISGYSPDYIGQLIRRGKLTGKQVYANVAWVTTREALRGYLEDKGKTKKPEDESVLPVPLSTPPAILPEPLREEAKDERPLPATPEEKVLPASPLVSEVQKWEQLIRRLSIVVIVAASIFLVLLFHIFSTLLDDRLERRALERASAPSLIHHL